LKHEGIEGGVGVYNSEEGRVVVVVREGWGRGILRR
jgi:hypothetical protein